MQQQLSKKEEEQHESGGTSTRMATALALFNTCTPEQMEKGVDLLEPFSFAAQLSGCDWRANHMQYAVSGMHAQNSPILPF